MNEPLPPKKAWEVDFPIEREEAQHVSRREFAKFLCVVSGGLCAGNAWLAVKDRLLPAHELTEPLRVCLKEEVPVGGMRAFVLPVTNIPYFLLHLEENKWRAFEQKCTHLSCAVYYRKDLGKIECPCHNGYFDAETGQVLQGPPPRALPQLEVEIRGGEVFVKPLSSNSV
jgi:cytochrome b6-f complex iron-sulfur subunit